MVPAESVAPPIGILTGPTASGKTELALELARRVPGLEIISADSLLVFREMNIGTAKPSREERTAVAHHLIDLCNPDKGFTAADFARAARQAIADIDARGARALIVGGTGFYLKALIHGTWDAPPTDEALRETLAGISSDALYLELEARDPESALRIGPSDRYRLVRAIEILRLSGRTPTELQAQQVSQPADPRFYALWVVDRESKELDARIERRARDMVASGLVEEVRALADRYPGARALGAVGYREALRFARGEPIPGGRKVPAGDAGLVAEIALATRQLVKAQRTWFRGQPSARWFVLDADREALDVEMAKVYGGAKS